MNLISSSIQTVNLSNNPHFKDISFKLLFTFFNYSTSLQSLKSENLFVKTFSLEKTNISDESGLLLCEILHRVPIKSLNLSSNSFTHKFFNRIAEIFENENVEISDLALANNKITDRSGIKLIEEILQFSKVKYLDLSCNYLKFKTGSSFFSLS
jgi:hypothetical protein